MKFEFTMTKDPAQACISWELQAEDGAEDFLRMSSSETLNKHQLENLSFVSVEQLRSQALLLLTQAAAQGGTKELSQLANDIVFPVIYQNLGQPWTPVDKYDTPPKYDPHWAKKIPHGKDI